MATKLIMAEIAKLSELEGVQVAVKESFKGGLTIGCAATAGSLLMGPVGLFVGGVLGSALTSWSKWGTYRSLVSVLTEDLTPRQQERLVDLLREALNQVSNEDLLKMLMLATGGGIHTAMREIMISTVKDFAVRELGMYLN